MGDDPENGRIWQVVRIRRRRASDQRRRRSLETPQEAARRREADNERHRLRRSVQGTQSTSTQRASAASRVRNCKRNASIRQSISLRQAALDCNTDESIVEEHYCGRMNRVCTQCGALHFEQEISTTSRQVYLDGTSRRQTVYSSCCLSGKVRLPELPHYPIELQNLMTGNDAMAIFFRQHIRTFNSIFSFASIGANIREPRGNGPYCYRINGAVRHTTGVLRPSVINPNDETNFTNQADYGHLFILDNSNGDENTGHIFNSDSFIKVKNVIQLVMERVNLFVHLYLMMHQVEAMHEQRRLQDEGNLPATPQHVHIAICNNRNSDPERLVANANVLAKNQIGVVFKTRDGLPPSDMDLIIFSHLNHYNRRKGVIRLHVTNPNREPLTFPILFPSGDPGWHPNIRRIIGPVYEDNEHIDESNSFISPHRTVVTLRDYLCYRISQRQNVFNPILNGGKLFQEYLVTSFVLVESARLEYLKQHQLKYRTDTLSGLRDYLNGDEEFNANTSHPSNSRDSNRLRPGLSFTLPSSFQGGPRYIQQNYQDAMAIIANFGRPDLFITMTCNPNWREIRENLQPWQCVQDRPDLVAKVFHFKLQELLSDITKTGGGIFGVVKAYVYVIEFQKRGLPHAHMLFILEDKCTKVDQIDQIVSAEIPDKDKFPRLHNIVTRFMIHKKCGDHSDTRRPCIKDDTNKCSKGFPKRLQESTSVSSDEIFPRYMRRKSTSAIIFDSNKQIINDNSWVIAYNPYLLLKFNCHINVEICASIKCVKYLYKYIFRGYDTAQIQTTVNEIKSYLDGRYVSAPEAAWRIFGYPLHAQSHSVDRLPVHLEHQQHVLIRQEDDSFSQGSNLRHLREQLASKENMHTMLTGYFELNKKSSRARQLLYHEIPTQFVWIQQEWRVRKRFFNKIGRMYSLSPRVGDAFYLRLLLLHVRGATSFKHLRTFNNVLYPTFKAACIARQLLPDENIWIDTFTDAISLPQTANFNLPVQLRSLLAILCVHAQISSLEYKIWNEFQQYFKQDYCVQLHQDGGENEFSNDDFENDCAIMGCVNYALRDLCLSIEKLGGNLNNYRLPLLLLLLQLNQLDQHLPPPIDILKEQQLAVRRRITLNEQQTIAFEAIRDAINDPVNKCNSFFLDGPGGSGKTYLYETLVHYIRGQGKSVLACATTGIAANLLLDGTTLHSLFKLQVCNNETTRSNLKPTDEMWTKIRDASLIIIDECTMASRFQIDAIDNLLREIMENSGAKDIPFGSKVLVFGGDFRQCLSIVPHSSRAAIIENSIKHSQSWKYVKTLSLTLNMRCRDPLYSNYLIDIGDGNETCGVEYLDERGLINISEYFITDNVVDFVFGSDPLSLERVRQIPNNAILCPKNADAHQLNNLVMDRLDSAQPRIYLSIDSKAGEDADTQFNNVEFFNTLNFSGMPPHKLMLKVGAIIMLLRNINPRLGLCNGTRLIITSMMDNLLQAQVISNGALMGQLVLIVRLDIISQDIGFKFQRRQFPVQLAFAMTINKSQGQTLDKVGLYLKDPVFTHGQLYVAMSRVRSFKDIRIQVETTPVHGKIYSNSDFIFTKNIVFKQIFNV